MNSGNDLPEQMPLTFTPPDIPAVDQTNKSGLYLFSSNHVESLLEAMGQRLTENPLDSVFAPEQIVTPSRAMGRWINLQLAQQCSIAANIEYSLPASWIWNLITLLLDNVPEEDPLNRAASSWKIFGLLPELIQQPAFKQLQHYLIKDSNDLKRWQLSAQIADVLDRYQLYRPQLIRDWSQGKPGKGEHGKWQAILWRELIKGHETTHRVFVIDRLLEQLHNSDSLTKKQFDKLPQRYSLFVLSTLPPLFVEILHALSRHCLLDIYHHSPTDQYWADLVNRRSIARKRLLSPDEADYYVTANELLASWGRQGQAFQDLLLNHNDALVAEWDNFRESNKTTLLHQLQSNIFSLTENDGVVAANDKSLQIHICHSPLRECQILHDQLLNAFAADNNLTPEDVLIMAPEISRYAPYIEAIFNKDEADSRPTIPWNLSDTTVADEHPLIRSFFFLLNLPNNRLTVSEVLSCLDIPELRKRFDLQDEAVESIHYMVSQSNVRWGADEQHKEDLGLPATLENTWKQAGQRIFAGYAMGADKLWNGTIAPLDINSTETAISLGKLWQLFEHLNKWRKLLAQDRTALEWQKALNKCLDDFFANLNEHDQFGSAEYRRDSDGKIQQIRDVLDTLTTCADDNLITPDLLQHWLNDSLGEQTVNGRYFSGGVTFCGMRPMRSLPFKVICLLGMNNDPFPRIDRPVEFDALKDQWRQGDPVKGDEDRYLFLETLLCAREKMIITYTGRDLKDNSERQPSVLVRELLDYIDEHYLLSADTADHNTITKSSASSAITTEHPLQSFSAANYQPDNPHSHDKYWFEVCNANIQAKEYSPGNQGNWPEYILPGDKTEIADRFINLNRFKQFFKHPVKFFFNEQLKLYITEHETSNDEEPFNLNALEKWQIKQDMLDGLVHDKYINKDSLAASGQLPHGPVAELEFSQIRNEIAATLEVLEPYRGGQAESRRIELALGDFVLSGQVGDCIKSIGLLHRTASSYQGKNLIPAWIDHLALCASGQLADDESSTLLTRDKLIQFCHLNEHQALKHLTAYLEVYQQGQTRPLPVLPNASWAWAQKEGSIEDKTKAAKYHWNNSFSFNDDWDDDYIKLAMRELEGKPFTHPEFAELADIIYTAPLRNIINNEAEQ